MAFQPADMRVRASSAPLPMTIFAALGYVLAMLASSTPAEDVVPGGVGVWLRHAGPVLASSKKGSLVTCPSALTPGRPVVGMF